MSQDERDDMMMELIAKSTETVRERERQLTTAESRIAELEQQLASARKKLAKGAVLFDGLHGEQCANWKGKSCDCEEQRWVADARGRGGA